MTPARPAGSSPCSLCAEHLDHCHGTLLVVAAGEFECSDDDCTDLRPVRHELVVWLTEHDAV